MSFDPDIHRVDADSASGYMAPELLSESNHPSKEADIYAFGMVAYEVVTGAPLSGQHGMVEVPTLTVQGWRPSKPEDPVGVGFGQGMWEFIEKCWDGNPKQRPIAREAVEHFKHATHTSMVVNPGPTTLVCEPSTQAPSKSGNSSKSSCECCILSTTFPT